jgi:hypothetical protein
MGSLISILAVAYFVGIVGICYQLTGEMAKEREIGMSQLIEAMMPNRQRWLPQAARLLSVHISFDILWQVSRESMLVLTLANQCYSKIPSPASRLVRRRVTLADFQACPCLRYSILSSRLPASRKATRVSVPQPLYS